MQNFTLPISEKVIEKMSSHIKNKTPFISTRSNLGYYNMTYLSKYGHLTLSKEIDKGDFFIREYTINLDSISSFTPLVFERVMERIIKDATTLIIYATLKASGDDTWYDDLPDLYAEYIHFLHGFYLQDIDLNLDIINIYWNAALEGYKAECDEYPYSLPPTLTKEYILNFFNEA